MPQYLARHFDQNPKGILSSLQRSERAFLCSSLRVRKKCSTEQKTLPDCTRCLALLSPPLFLARSKHENVALSGQMKGNQPNMSERPCLFLVYIYIYKPGPGFCVSRGLHGLLSCCELLLNRQRVSQPASQLSGKHQLLVAICVRV